MRAERVVLTVFTVAVLIGLAVGGHFLLRHVKRNKSYDLSLREAERHYRTYRQALDEAKPEEADHYRLTAESMFRRLAEFLPDRPEAWYHLALVEHERERYPQAIEHATRAVELLEADGESETVSLVDARFLLAKASYWSYVDQGGKAEALSRAIALFDAVVEARPDHVHAHMYLYDIFAHWRDDPVRARAHGDTVVRLEPDGDLARKVLEDRGAR